MIEGSAVCDPLTLDKKGKQVRHYERENSIVAHVINNLTCSMRFEGDLNVEGGAEQVWVIYYCNICHVYYRHLFIILNYLVF